MSDERRAYREQRMRLICADYFGSIPHADLLKSVARRIVDRRVTHRTGRADFPHPALGQDLTPSSTARRAQAGPDVRARDDWNGDRVGLLIDLIFMEVTGSVDWSPTPGDLDKLNLIVARVRERWGYDECFERLESFDDGNEPF
jgi:hypothetical protein